MCEVTDAEDGPRLSRQRSARWRGRTRRTGLANRSVVLVHRTAAVDGIGVGCLRHRRSVDAGHQLRRRPGRSGRQQRLVPRRRQPGLERERARVSELACQDGLPRPEHHERSGRDDLCCSVTVRAGLRAVDVAIKRDATKPTISGSVPCRERIRLEQRRRLGFLLLRRFPAWSRVSAIRQSPPKGRSVCHRGRRGQRRQHQLRDRRRDQYRQDGPDDLRFRVPGRERSGLEQRSRLGCVRLQRRPVGGRLVRAWRRSPRTAPVNRSPARRPTRRQQRDGDLSGINIDEMKPTIVGSIDPASGDGSNGWYVTSPTVAFTCADELSGVASCVADGTTPRATR